MGKKTKPIQKPIILWVGAAIAGAVAVGTTLYNRKSNRDAARRQLKINRAAWKEANEYNAPSAQMERLKAAGLNPNLVYGSGQVAGQTAEQIPQYQAPQGSHDLEMPTIGSTLGQYAEASVKQNQANNIKASTQNIEQDTINKGIEAQIKATAAKKKNLDYDNAEHFAPFQRQIIESQAKQQATTADNLVKTGKQITQNTSLAIAKTEYQKLANALAKNGIYPSDPLWARQISRKFKDASKAVQEYLAKYGAQMQNKTPFTKN